VDRRFPPLDVGYALTILGEICARTVQTRESVERWLSTDTYFTAKQALQARLVDEIIKPTMPSAFT
jgi:hypothetical protein